MAGEVITAATNKSKDLNNKIKLLYQNSDQVAQTLTSLNPNLLPYNVTQKMFHDHNKFVIDMTVARIGGDFMKEQKLYDAYYNELLMMSDDIYHAL